MISSDISSDINYNHFFVQWIPKKWQPLAILIRLDRPIGIYLAFLPALMGLHLAINSYNITVTCYFWLVSVIALGAFVMRSIGCICNDFFDRNIDSLIPRTAVRPLANRQVSLTIAVVMLILLCIVAVLLLLLCLPTSSWWLTAFIIPMIVIYPLMKRFFIIPQLVLGIVFTTGVWIGWLSLQNLIHWYQPTILYIACIFWVIGYDTSYAMQDLSDDRRQGVHSLAITAGHFVVKIIIFCYSLSTILWLLAIFYSRDSSILSIEYRVAIVLITTIIFVIRVCMIHFMHSLYYNIQKQLFIMCCKLKNKKIFTSQVYSTHLFSKKICYIDLFRSNVWFGLGISLSFL